MNRFAMQKEQVIGTYLLLLLYVLLVLLCGDVDFLEYVFEVLFFVVVLLLDVVLFF